MTRRHTDGFTLIEMVLVVAIVGLLGTLLLPALAGARQRARELQVQATIAGHAKVFAVYQTDNRDAFPALVPPGAASSTYFINSEPYTIAGYFGQVYVWQFGLAEQYFDSRVIGPLFQRPGRDPWLVTDYRYSASFMADPAFWNYASRIGPSQWRGQRGHAVRFPSSKALLVDDRIMNEFYEGGSGAIALVDASARHVGIGDLTAPFPPGEGDWPGTWSSGRPGVHTVDGVFGRDIP